MKTIFQVTGSILGMCGLFFSSGEAAIAGIHDISILSRNDNGSFLAICRNGDTETTSAYEIREDLVCEDNGNGNEEATSVFTCTGNSFFDRFYITRIENNERLGNYLPLEECRQLIAAASNDLICTGDNFFDRFYLTRISNGDRLGKHTSLSTCLQLLEDNGNGNEEATSVLTCTGDSFFDRFYITRIEDNERLGSYLPLEECRQLIATASNDLICTGDNFFDRFYLTRISNGDRLGGHTNLSTCLQLLEDTKS